MSPLHAANKAATTESVSSRMLFFGMVPQMI